MRTTGEGGGTEIAEGVRGKDLSLGIGYYIINFVDANFTSMFFYYYILVLLGLAVSIVISRRDIRKYLKSVGILKEWRVLAALFFFFVVAEAILVQPTHMLYNDEYIYESIAKTMIFDHIFGICSFSTPYHCINGTIGFFHQPGGWPLLEAVGFYAFGVHAYIAYDINLLLYSFSVVLVFAIAYSLFRDRLAAISAAAIFGFMPLVMTYSRSGISDISMLAFELLSVLLMIAYIKTKSRRMAVSAVFSIAFTMCTKVDGAVILPIALAILLLEAHFAAGRRRLVPNRKAEAAAIVLLVIVAIPQFMFLYTSLGHSFGAVSGQHKFSIQNFDSNIYTNLLFWTGRYSNVAYSTGYLYHVPFPIFATIFALFGAAWLARRKQYGSLAFLLAWFSVILIFYTFYYAGSFTYGLGDDARYFFSAFAALAILAGLGLSSAYRYVCRLAGLVGRNDRRKRVVLGLLIALLLVSNYAVLIKESVIGPPAQIAPFAAERADQAFLESNYMKIPDGCYVITFKPPFWYTLGYGNIYTTWVNYPQDYSRLMNLSGGCLYFDYSTSCYIGGTNGVYGNTENECSAIFSNFSVSEVAGEAYNDFGWNTTFAIYKILGRK